GDKENLLDPKEPARRRVIKAAAALSASATGLLGFNPRGFAQAGRTIKIGYVALQTGPLAGFGEVDRFAFAGINDALKGGIVVAGKPHPVEISIKDSQSNPNRAAE